MATLDRHRSWRTGRRRSVPITRRSLLPLPLPPSFEDVNPQESSPLYNGRLPPEIRNQIFEYALSETMSCGLYVPQVVFTPPPSVAVPQYIAMKMKETYPTLQAPVSLHFPYPPSTANGVYPTNTDYTRPGYKGVKRVDVCLLQTCKRVFLETYHLPFATKEHVFWHDAGPSNLKLNDELLYFQRFRADQLALIKRWHVFAKQAWLENIWHICRLDVLQGIEKLTITMRHCDWRNYERNALLCINPHDEDSTHDLMLLNRKKYEEGEKIHWNSRAWGSAFKELASLKELEMELECPDYKKPELDAIVLDCQKWRFPMRDDLVLSAERLPVKTEYWQAAKSRWTKKCPTCDGTDEDCALCAEKAKLISKGKGPRMVVMTVRWRLARKDSVSRFSLS